MYSSIDYSSNNSSSEQHYYKVDQYDKARAMLRLFLLNVAVPMWVIIKWFFFHTLLFFKVLLVVFCHNHYNHLTF